MRVLKKYPNRRLYDTEQSAYVTLEDVRQMVLAKESIKVVDSRTGSDLTRAVLLQIIADQEGQGHEPLLTNKVLEQLIRFYGDRMQGLLGRYIEQAITGFLDQQAAYERRMRDVLQANPLRMVQKFADQNVSFWRNLLQGDNDGEGPEAPPAAQQKSAGAAQQPPAAQQKPATQAPATGRQEPSSGAVDGPTAPSQPGPSAPGSGSGEPPKQG